MNFRKFNYTDDENVKRRKFDFRRKKNIADKQCDNDIGQKTIAKFGDWKKNKQNEWTFISREKYQQSELFFSN